MFQNPEILHTLAEIAIALVGFTGIVVALNHTRGSWSEKQLIQFSALIGPSLTALACCFVPALLAYFISDIDSNWRASNFILGSLHLVNIIPFFVMVQRSETNPATRSQKINSVIGSLTIIAHYVAALGLTPYLEAIFVFGVMQQLSIGLLNFVLSLRYEDDA